MLRRKVSLTILIFVAVFWRSSGIPKTQSLDHETIAGHKVLRIHQSAHMNIGSRDLSLPVVLFQDPRGIYWIGTITGLYSLDERTNHWSASIDEFGGSAGRFAQTIAWSNDRKLWVRSLVLHYLSVFDGERWRYVESAGAFKIEPSAPMLSSKSGKIWLALKSGILCYDNGNWRSLRLSAPDLQLLSDVHSSENSLNTLQPGKREGESLRSAIGIEDRGGTLWLPTRRAIVGFNPGSETWRTYQLPNRLQQVVGVYEDAIGRIWFSDSKGCVAIFNKADNSWIVHDLPQSLYKKAPGLLQTSFSVNGICQDKSGTFMFATDVGLISFKEERGEWSVYTKDNSGLPSDVVSALLIDSEGKIWVGTGKGIVVLEP